MQIMNLKLWMCKDPDFCNSGNMTKNVLGKTSLAAFKFKNISNAKNVLLMPCIKRISITNHIEAKIYICGTNICGNCKLSLKEIIEIVIYKIAKTVLSSMNNFFYTC